MIQRITATSVLMLAGMVGLTASAQPVNDDCINAIEVLDESETQGSTADATGADTSGCSVDDLYDVWYSFTPGSDKFVTFSLCGSDFDTSIAILDSCGGAVVACNDDSPECGVDSIARCVELTGGQTYLIRLAGFLEQRGDYTLRLSECAIPDNDDCANAIAIDKDIQVQGTTFASSGSALSGCSQNDVNDVWYSYTPASDEEVSVSLCGSSFDTTLSIFDNCGGAALACNEDNPTVCAFPGYSSQIGSFNMLGGNTYLLRVAGYGRARGNLQLAISDSSPPVVTSIVRAQPGPTAESEVFFYVYFDRPIQGFDSESDLVITANGVTHSGVEIVPSDDAYDVAIQGLEGQGDIAIAVNTGSDVRSLADVPLSASVTSDSILIDQVQPEISDVSLSAETAQPGDTVIIGFTASEALENVEVTVNGNLAESAKSALAYEYTVTESDLEGPAQLSILAEDVAGNVALYDNPSAFTIKIDTVPIFGLPLVAMLALVGAGVLRKKL
jgi:hypothetical protein